MGHNSPFPFKMNLVLKILKHGIRCLLTPYPSPPIRENSTSNLKDLKDKNSNNG